MCKRPDVTFALGSDPTTMPSKRRLQSTSIDDRSISGNPFDASRWAVKREGSGWVVLDALGNVIHESPTEAAANAWWVGITGQVR